MTACCILIRLTMETSQHCRLIFLGESDLILLRESTQMQAIKQGNRVRDHQVAALVQQGHP